MACGCQKGKNASSVSSRGTRVSYEVFGGSLVEPETFARLSEAKARSREVGARVRSKVLREPASV